MTDVQVAAEILSRMPDMMKDSLANNEMTLLAILRQMNPPAPKPVRERFTEVIVDPRHNYGVI